jgi:hypothetical protein
MGVGWHRGDVFLVCIPPTHTCVTHAHQPHLVEGITNDLLAHQQILQLASVIHPLRVSAQQQLARN